MLNVRGIVGFAVVLAAVSSTIYRLAPRQSPLQELVCQADGDHRDLLVPVTDERVAQIRNEWRDYQATLSSPELAIAKWHRDLAGHYESESPADTVRTLGHDPVGLSDDPYWSQQRKSAEREVQQASAYLESTRGAPPKFRLGRVLENRPYQITIVFALMGGLIMGLGYVHWRNECPAWNPQLLECHASFADSDNSNNTANAIHQIEADQDWLDFRQPDHVRLRRLALVTLMIVGIITVIL